MFASVITDECIKQQFITTLMLLITKYQEDLQYLNHFLELNPL